MGQNERGLNKLRSKSDKKRDYTTLVVKTDISPKTTLKRNGKKNPNEKLKRIRASREKAKVL